MFNLCNYDELKNIYITASGGPFVNNKFNEIKNSSNILPGHGGMFDRLDSFVMCSIAMLIFNFFIWKK